MAATQYILGIQPSYDGLCIEPRMPSDWQGFICRRAFRGVNYSIEVKRIGPGNQVRLQMNGLALDGSVVSFPPPDVSDLNIEVSIGTIQA